MTDTAPRTTIRWVVLIYCLPILFFLLLLLPETVNSITAIVHGTRKIPLWFPVLIGWYPFVSLPIIVMVLLRSYYGWLMASWAPILIAGVGGVQQMFFFLLHMNGFPNTIGGGGVGGIGIASGLCLIYGLLTFPAFLLLRKPSAKALFHDMPS